MARLVSCLRFSVGTSRQIDSAGCPMISSGVYEDQTGSVESVLLLPDALPRYPAWFLLTATCRFSHQLPTSVLSTES